jgi:hypothetical protein
MGQPLIINSQMKIMGQDTTPYGLADFHIKQLHADLKRVGADKFDMHLPETYALPYLINPGERVWGIVYGRYHRPGTTEQSPKLLAHGRGALIVTDHKVFFLDKKPSFIHYDEIPLDLISGITYTKAGPAGTVTLHTRTGDYSVRTFNQRCASNFVTAIEAARFGTPN